MTQTNFDHPSKFLYEGSLQDSGVNEANTKQPKYDIEFGRRLSYSDPNSLEVETIGTNQVILVLDADLTAQIDLTVKNTALATDVETVNPISEAFDTDHLTTMQNLEATLEALAAISAVTISDANNRTLTIDAAAGYIIEISSVSSAGVTFTQTNNDTKPRAGIAGYEPLEPFLNNGVQVSRYQAGVDAVCNIKKGNVSVKSPTGFDNTSTLYYVGYGANRGRLSNAAGDNGILATDVTHSQTASGADSMGVVSINQP